MYEWVMMSEKKKWTVRPKLASPSTPAGARKQASRVLFLWVRGFSPPARETALLVIYSGERRATTNYLAGDFQGVCWCEGDFPTSIRPGWKGLFDIAQLHQELLQS